MLRRQVRRLTVRFSVRSRRKKAGLITDYIRANSLETVILSGASGRMREPNEMIVERGLLEVADVVSGFDIVARGEMPWPSIVADGRHLPYRDGAVDLVVSNAVIEHVGGEADQRTFVAEHLRVGKHCVITTPNRWFPVESHTSAVLRHWSPAWRESRREFTRLLSLWEFRELLPPETTVIGRPWSATFVAFIGPGALSR